jgi:hypothetical protein
LNNRRWFKGWPTTKLAPPRRLFNHRDTRVIRIRNKTMSSSACIGLTQAGIGENAIPFIATQMTG